MGFSTVRKGVIALAALLLLALLFVAALPWLASTQIVRDRIAYELGLWSGYRVSLGEAPELDVWPTFRATLRDVSFHEWAQSSHAVLAADRMDVSLSPLAALRGEVVMTAISMHRPLLRVTHSGPMPDLPASPGGGRIVRAIDNARQLVSSSPASPDLGSLPSDTFGTVEFFDGRIALVNGEESDTVTSLTGRITWPALNRPARIIATGIWRGENVSADVSVGSPLLLMAGGNSQITTSLKSTLFEASFEGSASLTGDAFFDGGASLASPSLRRMLEWAKTPIAPGAAIGAISVSSAVQGNAKRLRLDSVTLTLGGNSGRGVVDLSFAEPVPAISGTLAFDKFDLRSFLAAFSPVVSNSGNIHDPIETGFSEQISLDLRLSAALATYGSVTLSDMAASTQVKGSLAAFDISDANVFGGELQAGVRIDAAGEDKVVEMRLMASNTDALALAKAAGAERLLPQGRANISVMLKGTGRDWNTVMRNAEGSVSASLGPGALAGVDLGQFRERWASGGFFSLAEVSDGTLPLRGFDFKAKVTGGVARIEKANALLEQERELSLSGIIPYFSRALALSGHVTSVAADGSRGPAELPFFLGGAWDAPFVSPVGASEFE